MSADALKTVARRLSSAAFTAGMEDAGDAWTRQEKACAKQDQLLAELLAGIDALAAAKVEQPANQLRSRIMNLQVDPRGGYDPDMSARLAYLVGHRDARHAAAELASEFAAVEQPVAVHAEPTNLIQRLKAAIEGECDGLAVDDAHAKAILEYVLGHQVASPGQPLPLGIEPSATATMEQATVEPTP